MTPEESNPHAPNAIPRSVASGNRNPFSRRKLATFEEERFGILNDLIIPRLQPLTLAALKTYRIAIKTGQHSYVDYQAVFASLCVSREAILDELKTRFPARQLARLATVLGATGVSRATKTANAESIYRGVLRMFVLDDTFAVPIGARLEEAVANKVLETTNEAWLAFYCRQAWERERARE